ncbi:hypothetical protein HELRODRAFT_183140 [Helobdella robusta]|uniref:Uncharacterized protein n=1 Tax=Helobdella robusta TaxID=6412 RepID=T1FJ70_HELRO|nr:hypothetical protein HELRODRAFT_183140 [Helobdella robusta]ESO11447.1 hypothetical protein HELRODRAFT_183140 [Helobdella robusta]
MSSQGSASQSASFTRCHVCFKHNRSRHDGTLVKNGGKVKGTECSCSLKMPPSVAGRKSVGGRIGNLSMAGVKPKTIKTAFGQVFINMLKNICDHPSESTVWFKLLFLPKMVLYEDPRGGRGRNISVQINSRLDAFTSGPFEVKAMKPVLKDERGGGRQPKICAMVKSKSEKGTSGGRDDLTPQHLKDMAHEKTETTELINAVTCFINLLLNGVCPLEVVPYMFGWTQAVFPVGMEGLGLGVEADLASSAFLSSAAATATLQTNLLPDDGEFEDHLRIETFNHWCFIYGNVNSIDLLEGDLQNIRVSHDLSPEQRVELKSLLDKAKSKNVEDNDFLYKVRGPIGRWKIIKFPKVVTAQ